MSSLQLADIARKMRGIDIAMLSTDAGRGAIASRPMSNNGEVDYDGDSFYFTDQQARSVAEIGRNAKVSLTFDDGDGFWLAVTGGAELIRDRAAFEQHWSPDLDKWFKAGIDTPGIVLIKGSASYIRYWDGEDGGEVDLG